MYIVVSNQHSKHYFPNNSHHILEYVWINILILRMHMNVPWWILHVQQQTLRHHCNPYTFTSI